MFISQGKMLGLELGLRSCRRTAANMPALGRYNVLLCVVTTLRVCVAAAAAWLLFSTVLCLLTTAASARAVMTSPTRWRAPCSGASDVTGTSRDVSGDVTETPATTSTDDLASTFRKISIKMKRLKSRVRELKNIYVSPPMIVNHILFILRETAIASETGTGESIACSHCLTH